jgi:hypothetical protein
VGADAQKLVKPAPTSMTGVVSVLLQGGLGNRLFQVAAAWSYAQVHHRTFVLSRALVLHNQHSSDNYETGVLGCFGQWVPSLKPNPQMIREPLAWVGSFWPLPAPLAPDRDVVLAGFFQNHLFFHPGVQGLWKIPPDTHSVLHSQFSCLSSSLFLHVRRSDYLEVAVHRPFLNYRRKALELFTTQSSSTLLLISDDPEGAQTELLAIPHTLSLRVVSGLNEIQTLWLMTECRLGGICTNSSFGWWGAFLNPEKGRTFVVPRPWFLHQSTFTGMCPAGAVELDDSSDVSSLRVAPVFTYLLGNEQQLKQIVQCYYSAALLNPHPQVTEIGAREGRVSLRLANACWPEKVSCLGVGCFRGVFERNMKAASQGNYEVISVPLGHVPLLTAGGFVYCDFADWSPEQVVSALSQIVASGSSACGLLVVEAMPVGLFQILWASVSRDVGHKMVLTMASGAAPPGSTAPQFWTIQHTSIGSGTEEEVS